MERRGGRKMRIRSGEEGKRGRASRSALAVLGWWINLAVFWFLPKRLLFFL